MIYYFTPYSTEKNLGKYYNECMAMIPFGSWACFTDGDAMFTTPDFGHQLEDIVRLYGDEYKLFTAKTNRVGTKYQCVEGVWDIDCMSTHRNIGKMLQLNKRLELNDITNAPPMSGVLMLLEKNTWNKSNKFKEAGLLGIDNSIHYSIRNTGNRVGLMEGVYIQHFYRNGSGDNSHLK